jgi:hypothetical protein
MRCSKSIAWRHSVNQPPDQSQLSVIASAAANTPYIRLLGGEQSKRTTANSDTACARLRDSVA